MIVIGKASPFSFRIWVMPIFFPMIPSIMVASQSLDFHFDTGGKIHLLKLFNSLLVVLGDLDHPLVGPDLEVFTGLLIHMGRTENAETLDLRRQGDRAGDMGARILRLFHQLDGGFVQQTVVKSSQFYTNLFHGSILYSYQ